MERAGAVLKAPVMVRLVRDTNRSGHPRGALTEWVGVVSPNDVASTRKLKSQQEASSRFTSGMREECSYEHHFIEVEEGLEYVGPLSLENWYWGKPQQNIAAACGERRHQGEGAVSESFHVVPYGASPGSTVSVPTRTALSAPTSSQFLLD